MNTKLFALAGAAAAILLSCEKPTPQAFHVIPLPQEVILDEGYFNIEGASILCDEALDNEASEAISAFRERLETVTGHACKRSDRVVSFSFDPSLGSEAYKLTITPEKVIVKASAKNGVIYATETIKQMLPAEVYSSRKESAQWVLPCAEINDYPRFGYRGAHLDACRHFWSIEETKRYIDVMATYKLNRLHWHLSDDQGWRAEIKAYPRLTEVGAWRDGTCIRKNWDTSDGIRYGGFYTQDQMREIVAYAASKGITVIPEIDLPGHMLAALTAYPNLGCTGGPYKVWQRWGVAKDILCAGNEEIFPFLEGVLKEIIDIFPSEYIHVGGDECFHGDAEPDRPDPWEVCPKCKAKMKELGLKGPKAKNMLQTYVTGRIQRFLEGYGRKIIGWDEILQGNLRPGATVMSWRGTEGGKEAANKGFDAIMTPNSHLYLDYYQGDERDKEPFGIGGRLPLEKVYSYEPLEGLSKDAAKHILGLQGNLWTEYIQTPEHLEYMLLPRLCAISEVQWCEPGNKDYKRFDESLDHTFEILDAMGVNYSLDCRGLVGLERIPARSEKEMDEYMATKTWSW